MAADIEYRCPECGLHYERETSAKACEAWCREHNSCNLLIAQESVESKQRQANLSSDGGD